MAVTFASVQSTTPSATTSVVITKPVSLAVGDLMVAHIGCVGTSPAITTLAGWTQIQSQDDSTTGTSKVMYKIADSGDVAASNFTFTTSGTGVRSGGAIYRITGINPASTIDVSSKVAYASGTSISEASASITPTRASDLLLMLITGTIGSAGSPTTVSSQAIATSNPSWTEDYEMETTVSSNTWCMMCGAHATRPQTTATGATSFTLSRAISGTLIMVAVSNTVSTSVTSVAGTLTLTGGTNAVKVGIRLVTTAVTLTLTAGSNLVKRVAKWVNTTKNSSSWTNTDKTQQ